MNQSDQPSVTGAGTSPRKLPRGKLCDVRASLDVRLIQQGKDSFAVVYGRQIKERLNYSQAAHEYGACIMHALACDGRLDHREYAERTLAAFEGLAEAAAHTACLQQFNGDKCICLSCLANAALAAEQPKP